MRLRHRRASSRPGTGSLPRLITRAFWDSPASRPSRITWMKRASGSVFWIFFILRT